jgi:hypothetical protein
MPPQPVRQAMHDNGMNTGVAGEHLPGGTGGWVAVENRTNILTQIPKHQTEFPIKTRGNFKILD